MSQKMAVCYYCDTVSCFYYETVIPGSICPSCERHGLPEFYFTGIVSYPLERWVLGFDVEILEVNEWEEEDPERTDVPTDTNG